MVFGAGHVVEAEGQIQHEALFPIEVRADVTIAGLLIWGLYAIYKVVATTPTPASTGSV